MKVATFAPRPLHPQGKLSGTHRVTGWTRPRASLCVWKINLLALTGVEPWLPRRPARSLSTIPTALSRPPIYMLFTPKRMWMKPSHFLLPCKPQTAPRATKRTIHSTRLWNGYYAYRTRKMRMTACLGEHTLIRGQPRPLVSLNCLYLRYGHPVSEKTYQSPLPILKPSHRFFCFFNIATGLFTATYSLRMGRSWCDFGEVVGHYTN